MTERQKELFAILAGPVIPFSDSLTSAIQTRWDAITGAPGSGKSTVCAELIKAGYQVVPEASRAAIGEAQHRGYSPEEIFSDRVLLATAIANRKLRIAHDLLPSEKWVWDTGLVDALVFCRLAEVNLTRLEPALLNYRFRGAIILDRLPTSAIDGDRVRPQTEQERELLQWSLEAEYKAQGYRISRIPTGSISDRTRLAIGVLNGLVGPENAP